MGQDLPEQHPLADVAVPLACTTQTHRAVGQSSPGLPPLTKAEGWAYRQQGPAVPPLAKSPQFSLGSLDADAAAQLGPAGWFQCTTSPASKGLAHTQSKNVICARVTPEGPSPVAGFEAGTVQTLGRRHVACECLLAQSTCARSSWVGELCSPLPCRASGLEEKHHLLLHFACFRLCPNFSKTNKTTYQKKTQTQTQKKTKPNQKKKKRPL